MADLIYSILSNVSPRVLALLAEKRRPKVEASSVALASALNKNLKKLLQELGELDAGSTDSSLRRILDSGLAMEQLEAVRTSGALKVPPHVWEVFLQRRSSEELTQIATELFHKEKAPDWVTALERGGGVGLSASEVLEMLPVSVCRRLGQRWELEATAPAKLQKQLLAIYTSTELLIDDLLRDELEELLSERDDSSVYIEGVEQHKVQDLKWLAKLCFFEGVLPQEFIDKQIEEYSRGDDDDDDNAGSKEDGSTATPLGQIASNWGRPRQLVVLTRALGLGVPQRLSEQKFNALLEALDNLGIEAALPNENQPLASIDLPRVQSKTKLRLRTKQNTSAVSNPTVTSTIPPTHARKMVWGSTAKTRDTTTRKIDRDVDVVLIQTEPTLGIRILGESPEENAISAVLRVFSNENQPKGKGWLAFLGSPKKHYKGLTLWLGFSRNVPEKVVDDISEFCEALGATTSREMANANRQDLTPCVYYGEDGFELLIPESTEQPDEVFSGLLLQANNKATVRRCLW